MQPNLEYTYDESSRTVTSFSALGTKVVRLGVDYPPLRPKSATSRPGRAVEWLPAHHGTPAQFIIILNGQRSAIAARNFFNNFIVLDKKKRRPLSEKTLAVRARAKAKAEAETVVVAKVRSLRPTAASVTAASVDRLNVSQVIEAIDRLNVTAKEIVTALLTCWLPSPSISDVPNTLNGAAHTEVDES